MVDPTGPWENGSMGWNTAINLHENNRILADNLRKWNSTEFGNIFKKKERLKARIAGVQCSLDQHFAYGLVKLEIKKTQEGTG